MGDKSGTKEVVSVTLIDPPKPTDPPAPLTSEKEDVAAAQAVEDLKGL